MADIIVKGLTLGGVDSISAEGADGGTIEFLPESGFVLQEKSVTPTDTAQEIVPDDGKYGLSKVSISAARLQSKSATPTDTAQTIVPDSGYYGLSKVTVGAGGGGDLPAAEDVSVTASTASLADAYEIQGSTLLGLLQEMISITTPVQDSLTLTKLVNEILPNSNMVYTPPNALIQGEDGYYYLYKNGVKQMTGLTEVNGNIYYLSQITGRAAVGVDVLAIFDAGVHSSASALGYGAGNYAFDDNGIMKTYVAPSVKTGAFYEDGAIYYYNEGAKKYQGAWQDGCGDIMYFNSSKVAIFGRDYAVGETKSNGIIEPGTYTFDSNGRCTNPVWA